MQFSISICLVWHLLLDVQPTQNMFLTEFIFFLLKFILSTRFSISAYPFHNHLRGQKLVVWIIPIENGITVHKHPTLLSFCGLSMSNPLTLTLLWWHFLVEGLSANTTQATFFKEHCSLLLTFCFFPSYTVSQWVGGCCYLYGKLFRITVVCFVFSEKYYF